MLREHKPKTNSDKSTGCPSSFLFPADAINSWENDLTLPSGAWRCGWIQDSLGERERENEWESSSAWAHNNLLASGMSWLPSFMTEDLERNQEDQGSRLSLEAGLPFLNNISAAFCLCYENHFPHPMMILQAQKSCVSANTEVAFSRVVYAHVLLPVAFSLWTNTVRKDWGLVIAFWSLNSGRLLSDLAMATEYSLDTSPVVFSKGGDTEILRKNMHHY